MTNRTIIMVRPIAWERSVWIKKRELCRGTFETKGEELLDGGAYVGLGTRLCRFYVFIV